MKVNPPRALLIVVLGLVLVSPVRAEEPPGEDPKLVLVLSGGGARGIAHIGVIRVLEELRIAPDLIVGTSMGSIVGGLYAAGWSPDEMEELVRSIDWGQIFSDHVERGELSFRRKQDDRPVMIRGRLHPEGFKPGLPSGVIGGQHLELVLRVIEALSPKQEDFDDLPIPFRAVAADLATGEAVVIGSGSLATAMRASMSIPGAVPPVELDGRLLVDGGITANLPIGIAQGLGADRIIAVDISSPLLGEEQELETFMNVYSQLNSLLTVRNREGDVARLQPGDVLIVPDLGDITFVSFDRGQQSVAIGERAARLQTDELRRLSATDRRWAEFDGRPRAQALAPLKIDRLRFENSSRVDDRLVSSAISIDPPQILDRKTLPLDLLGLYNTRYFGVIGFALDEVEENVHELVVETPPPPHARSSMQFGIGLLDDFDGGSTYHVRARYQYLPANRRGGEWETLFQLGTALGARTSFYQPLDWGMKWFVEPSLNFERGTQEIWVDGQAWAEYQFSGFGARLDAGRVLGRWGELRLGAFTRKERGSPRIGLPEFESGDERRGGGLAQFRIDTEDSVVFPRSGSSVELVYERSSEILGADTSFERFWGSASYAWSFGENTVVPSIEYGGNLDPAESFFSSFFMGGLFRLSGLGNRELVGERVALAKVLGYRRLLRFEVVGMKMNIYAGLSLEAGNAYLVNEAISFQNAAKGGSVFLGGDTFIGPIILAYGRNEGNRDRFYLAIGEKF
jgi:NTE family protein